MFKRTLTILYGSQTGTAEDIAEDIWRESKQFNYTANVKAMDLYNLSNLIHENFVIFICSTTGQGEEPDNMKKFWKFLLQKKLPANSLSNLQFSVLGLGDSSYSKFNFVAKRLHKRLLQLGANPFQAIGLCDDQHDLGYAAVSVAWKKQLWMILNSYTLPPDSLENYQKDSVIFKWNVEICDENNTDLSLVNKDFVFDESNLQLNVLSNERTTAKDHFQDVRLISLSSDNVSWNPGDVFLCRPQNLQVNIDTFFQLMAEHKIGLSRDTIIRVNQLHDEFPVPKYFSNSLPLETLVRKYWDLNALPRPRVFTLLSINCTNELEKEKLLELANPEFQENLYNYVNRPKRTILEVLSDFPHATSSLTIQLLFEIFKPIRPRSFSIASSSLHKKLELLVAVVEYNTILSTSRLGLCSNWMKQLKNGETIRGWIKPGTFKIPQDKESPIIMIGPGTGLAPFRSILQDRLIKYQTISNIVLFFGCRYHDKDFHCRSDLLNFEANGLKLFCAFSRDQTDKIYVQHLITREEALIKGIIAEINGSIMLAGNSKDMPSSVKTALNEMFNDDNFVNQMIKCNKFQEEVWA